MVTAEDYMKFMKSSEPIFFPKEINRIREIVKKFDKSCIVIKDLDIHTYFVGKPNISKSDSVYYIFEDIFIGEINFAYSNLRGVWVPRNLCPEQLRL